MPPQNQGEMMPQKSGMPTWLIIVIVLLVIGALGFVAILGAGYFVTKKIQNSLSNTEIQKTVENINKRPTQVDGFDSGDVATEIHKMFAAGKTPEEIAQAFVAALKRNIPAGAIDKTDAELYANALLLVKQELAVPTVK